MIKKLYAKDVIDLWGKRLDDENIISEIFDYFEFDCLLRCYVDLKVLCIICVKNANMFEVV